MVGCIANSLSSITLREALEVAFSFVAFLHVIQLQGQLNDNRWHHFKFTRKMTWMIKYGTLKGALRGSLVNPRSNLSVNQRGN